MCSIDIATSVSFPLRSVICMFEFAAQLQTCNRRRSMGI
jgi:hypothetical protein